MDPLNVSKESGMSNFLFGLMKIYWYERNNRIMPMKYINQMIYDWEATGKKFNDSAKEYYLKNKCKIRLHKVSQWYLEKNWKSIMKVKKILCSKCKKQLTDTTSFYYIDGNNIAITKNSKPHCLDCYNKTYRGVL